MKGVITHKRLLFPIFILLTTANCFSQSLRFTDTSYVNIGNASSLHLTNFTIEARIKIEGYGSTTETGSTGSGGGQTGVVPIITKGRAQSESASVDINYFLGYRLSDMKLVADFEDNGTSLNHSVVSTAALPMNQWIQVGASFNVSTQTWRLFIGTTAQTFVLSGGPFTPQSASNVNACIGSSLNTGGTVRAGFFNGRIDEVRIWNTALTALNPNEVTSGTGLVGRWGMNEGSGIVIANSLVGGAAGTFSTINPVWVSGFNQTDATTNASVDFNGVHDYITFGTAPSLNTTAPASTGFTLEAWIKIEGNGVTTSTGTGGVTAIPIVAKGRSESDASGINMNYFLGITSTDVLVADFEEASGSNTGLNHPISGSGAGATVTRNVWTHVAVTYSISSGLWNLYKNGVNVGTLGIAGGIVPENISKQYASIGSALNSTGVPAGFFYGKIDEVRIWNRPLSPSEISANMNLQLTGGSGLLGRWGLNENGNVTATNSIAGSVNGTLRSTNISTHPTNGGPSWSTDGFVPNNNNTNQPPNQPANPSPANNTLASSLSPNLCANVSDPNGGTVRVRFFGRKKPNAGQKFTVIVLPDTQYYTAEPQGTSGGNNNMFKAQTKWIVDNRQTRNIVYVGQLGDCTNNGDDPPGADNTIEWRRADTAIKTIESASLTGLAEGIPYGISVGNHDQTPNGSASGTTNYFNQYFGAARFSGRSYYGGHFGSNNDNFYDLFSASGVDFLVISLEYNTSPTDDVLSWAANLVQTYSTRKVIVMTHYGIDESTAFGTQGAAIYNKLKIYPNFILFVCGHIHQSDGESRRSDVYNGNTVHTLLSDYQGRTGGGNGLLRIYEFDPSANKLSAKTFSPYTNTFETDADSQFDLDISLSTVSTSFTLLGETTNVSSGTNTCVSWPSLLPSAGYEWYVEVSDGQLTMTGPVWTFTTPAQSITRANAVSVEETNPDWSQSNHGIQIYPNPATNRGFQIRINDLNTKKILVSIYDMNGKLYLQKQYGSANGIVVDHHLTPGMYMVKIVAENFIANRKLVIK